MHFKDHSHYSPIIFLATWYGVIYIIDFISISMHMEEDEKWKSISEEYLTKETLMAAEPRP